MTERELIRELRGLLVKSCHCAEVRVDRNSEVCGDCILVGIIDEGLAKIGEAEDLKKKQAWDDYDAAKLKRKSDEALRSNDTGKAIRLYNEALKKERANR